MNRIMINISDIKIPARFARTTPTHTKIDRCRRYFAEHGCLDRDIVISNTKHLKDGYIGYLVLLENGIRQTEVAVKDTSNPSNITYRNSPTIYVYGRHKTSPKEYCWRITKGTQGLENLKLGNKMIVRTKRGKSVATIVRVEELDTPPVAFSVRGVMRCLDE